MASLLLVDDSVTLRRLARRALEQAALFDEIIEASDGLEAWKRLAEKTPDIVVSDLNMPRCDGVKLLHLRRNRPELAHVPFILLTSEDDRERKADLLELGAADYVVKPFHERELVARVRLHLKLRLLQEELRLANAKLHALSTTDGLTGLSNRRHFDETLALEVARAERYGTSLTLLIGDIDRFKSVNDNHGHPAGDEVIKTFARVLREGIRNTDLAARFGGEEFAVIMPHTDLAGAVLVAERLRSRLAESVTHIGATKTLTNTASFGVALLPAGGASAPSDLLRAADEALYAAKQGGRNQVVPAAPIIIPSERPQRRSFRAA